jgi:site-specific recombinase XerC
MVFLAVCTGLRVGELLGLKWKDIDFQKMEIHIIRWNSRTNGSLMASSGVTKSLCYELSACSSMAALFWESAIRSLELAADRTVAGQSSQPYSLGFIGKFEPPGP